MYDLFSIFTSTGISYQMHAENNGKSTGAMYDFIQRMSLYLKDEFDVFKPTTSDIVVFDEFEVHEEKIGKRKRRQKRKTGNRKKKKSKGHRRDGPWVPFSICPFTKIVLSMFYTQTRNNLTIGSSIRITERNIQKKPKIVISDDLREYSTQLRAIHPEIVKTLYVNRSPKGENLPKELKANCIKIEENNLMLSFIEGLNSKEIIETRPYTSHKQIAEIILELFGRTNYVLINSNKVTPFNNIITELHNLAKDDNYIYHIITDCKYFKAYAERVVNTFTKRLKWFNKLFRNPKAGQHLTRLQRIYYNVFDIHGAIKQTPFEKGEVVLPKDKVKRFEMLLGDNSHIVLGR